VKTIIKTYQAAIKHQVSVFEYEKLKKKVIFVLQKK